MVLVTISLGRTYGQTTIVRVRKILIALATMGLIASAGLLTLRAQSKARAFELTAASPKFWDLFEHDAKLTTIGTGFGFTEGPVWDPAGFLFVSDEETNKIFRLYIADGRKEEVLQAERMGKLFGLKVELGRRDGFYHIW